MLSIQNTIIAAQELADHFNWAVFLKAMGCFLKPSNLTSRCSVFRLVPSYQFALMTELTASMGRFYTQS